MPEVYQSSNAAKNIADVISAMTDAQKSQLDLKKAVMMKQIGDKEDLMQKGKEQIQEQSINYNMPGVFGDKSGGGQQTQADGTNGAGRATNATASTVGAVPQLAGQPQSIPANPMAPTPTPQAPPTPNPTPMLTAGAQRPNSPALNGIVPPAGVSIPSPIGKPLPPPQGKIIIGQDGKPMLNPNVGSMDNKTYAGIYQKWASGQPLTNGETKWVQTKFSNDNNGQPIKKLTSSTVSANAPIPNAQNTSADGVPTTPTGQSDYQQKRAAMEAKFDMPSGSMWFNPGTQHWEANPIYMKQIEAKNNAEAQVAARQPENDVKTAQNIDKALDPSYYRAGAFGDSKKVFDRGERLESMIDYANRYQQGGADSRQIVELATGFQSQLTGGNARGNYQQVQDLIPHTMVGNVNKMAEWLTNNPRGANQQAFVDRMMQSVHRENATVQAQMERTKFQRLATFDDFAKRNPDEFDDMLRSNGVDPDKYRQWKKDGYKQTSAVQDSPEASGISAPTIFNPKTGKTMTLSADGKSWQ